MEKRFSDVPWIKCAAALRLRIKSWASQHQLEVDCTPSPYYDGARHRFRSQKVSSPHHSTTVHTRLPTLLLSKCFIISGDVRYPNFRMRASIRLSSPKLLTVACKGRNIYTSNEHIWQQPTDHPARARSVPLCLPVPCGFCKCWSHTSIVRVNHSAD